jgi:hypothetical protein
MGRAIAITRTDISARELRFIAKQTRDCRVVRRILAIAVNGKTILSQRATQYIATLRLE